jgi:hypothetical protein
MKYGVIPWIFGAFLALGVNATSAGNPSLDRILPTVRQHHPGKFYDAEGPWRGPDGQYRYRLKWMTPNGRVVWFDADARTGRVLGPDSETHGYDRAPPRFRDDERRFIPDEERRWNRGGRWPREDHPHLGGRPRRGR